ncbi:MAG TPA: glycosyltransferase family 39 protein [Rhodanobacteraceae bacterium]|nr:glycosyltransferase family 39 protein [Rhodanobacteraceae bacterium]
MMRLAARLIPILVLVAAWWPSRITGLLDGAPFDNAPDAIVLGLLLPVLLWLAPAAFRTRRAQVVVLVLLAWKAFSSSALVQDGWCVRVEPSRPYVRDGIGAPKAWDVRTDWLAADPRCSAIATRPYLTDEAFPVWFFNLPSATGDGPSREDLPPAAVTRLEMTASVRVHSPGTLRVRTSSNVAASLIVDGRAQSSSGVEVAAGPHDLVINATLTGEGWSLAPLWNDADLFATLPSTISRPSALDRSVRPWSAWISMILVAALVMMGIASLWREIADWRVAWWVSGSLAAGAIVATWVPARRWHYAMVPLIASVLLPVPDSLRNMRGAVILLAPLWLSLHVVDTYYDIGFHRMQLLAPGNDWWQFQRYAYRIYMQGYWLEGGEPTFWFRPLYRWVAGALHLLFGQGQTGENYWDAIGVLIIALFSFEVVRRLRGFKWGLAAGALALTAYLSGPGHVFIGRGLSEITSAAFLYLAALCVLAARESRSTKLLIAAGAFAVLGAWTRENNLPMALAATCFAWPLTVPASMLWQPRRWLDTVSPSVLIAIPAALLVGTVLFALRTWYYTGEFALPWFHSQINHLAVWQPGMPLREALAAMLSSVMMVATTTDPPSYHHGALPILAGAALSVLALVGVPFARRLPLVLVAWTISGFVSALIARGTAYSGRFSIHVVGSTVAVLMCAMAAVFDRRLPQHADANASAAARTS